MRKLPALTVSGIVTPTGGWPENEGYSIAYATEYRVAEFGPVPLQTESPAGTVDAETLALYRQLYSRPDGRMLLGVAEYIPKRNTQETITSMCGRGAKILAWEFEKAASGKQAAGLAILQAHAAAGGIVGLHAHPDNFATGGNYQDRTGSPVAAIKPGGANHAAYRAYLDDVAAFITSIGAPVIYRPLHEMNGNWFWWNGADRAADLVLVWQDTVDYLRTTKGLTNVLFSWNIHGAVGNGGVTDNVTTAYSTWWPGAAYVDLVSMDLYDNGATPTLLRNGYAWKSWQALLRLAVENNRPIYIAEIGSSTGAQAVAGFWKDACFDHLDSYPGCSAVCLWTTEWAPAPGTAAAASFVAGAAERAVLR